jgi:hypothetical protein
VAAAAQGGGAVPGLAVTDTIKAVDAAGTVVATPARQFSRPLRRLDADKKVDNAVLSLGNALAQGREEDGKAARSVGTWGIRGVGAGHEDFSCVCGADRARKYPEGEFTLSPRTIRGLNAVFSVEGCWRTRASARPYGAAA